MSQRSICTYLAAGGGGDDTPPVVLVGLGDPEAVILLLLRLPITSEDLVALAAHLVFASGVGRVHVAGADGLGLVAHGDGFSLICGSWLTGKDRQELDAGTYSYSLLLAEFARRRS
jgi:hypothetical protein